MLRNSVLGLITLLFATTHTGAQEQIATDPAVRIGRLDNGMTYYVRHNAVPAGRADFYIVFNVGAMEEEDAQQGLAHIIEHMAFRGTRNMPEGTITNFFRSLGMRVGVNYNAATAIEHTYYMMAGVPLERESVVDSVLLILHDWSQFVTLDEDKVDYERGVVLDELRRRNDAHHRLRDKINPVLYNGSRYGMRNIISDEEQIRSFPHQELTDFYARWYRPDLQAVIAVGDFDADEMERKLREVMSNVPMQENPAPKQYYPIPNNELPVVIIATDPELNGTSVNLYVKRAAQPVDKNNTFDALVSRHAHTALGVLTTWRLTEIARQQDAPFTNASFSSGAISNSNDALIGGMMPREGRVGEAFEAFYTEIERIRRYGFEAAELERFKGMSLERARQTHSRSANRSTGELVQAYMKHYLKNEPVPDAETQWQLDSAALNMLTVEMINALMSGLITATNNTIIVSAPESHEASLPSREELTGIMERTRVCFPPAGL